MSEKILNACSISELQALRKEVENTAYTDQDSEMLLGMIDDRMSEVE